jgi:hypothetical protein
MRKRSNGKILVCCLFALSFLMSWGTVSKAADAKTTVLPTGVTTPADGYELVGVEGNFVISGQEAVDAINKIRLEACQNGYRDPRDSSKTLTLADYTPIQWSYDLEYMARIRAAEATVMTEHSRPGVASLTSPNAVSSSGESLAWCGWNGTMLDAIDLWETEKSAWVNNTAGAVTGHYTAMINPNNLYVGIGCFQSKYGVWATSACARFSRSKTALDTTMMEAQSNCIQTIDVKQTYLSEAELIAAKTIDEDSDLIDSDFSSGNSLKIGNKQSYVLVKKSTIGDDVCYVNVLGTITWTSSDKSVATVDNYGNVKI